MSYQKEFHFILFKNKYIMFSLSLHSKRILPVVSDNSLDGILFLREICGRVIPVLISFQMLPRRVEFWNL